MLNSAQGTDLWVIIVLVVLIIIGYIAKDPHIKFLAYIFVSLLLIWRGIVYIRRAITVAQSF